MLATNKKKKILNTAQAYAGLRTRSLELVGLWTHDHGMIERQTDRHTHIHTSCMATEVKGAENKVSQRQETSGYTGSLQLIWTQLKPSLSVLQASELLDESRTILGFCFQFQVPSQPQTQLVSLNQLPHWTVLCLSFPIGKNDTIGWDNVVDSPSSDNSILGF